MKFDFKSVEYTSPRYIIDATWQARIETPQELAARFVRQIDLLVEIDPLFALWTCGAKRPVKFENARATYATEVEAGLSRDDWGEPVPVEGYGFGAITRGHPRSRSYAILATASAHMRSQTYQNSIGFSTSSMTIPDPEAVTYRIFKASLLSIVKVWDPMEVSARPQALLDHVKHDGLFREAWMQYLAPPLASLVTPPTSVIVEHTPDGGLLMSATTETFRVDNAEHLAAARDIAKAIAPLNALPYVTDRGY